jgi:phage terminase small subunit
MGGRNAHSIALQLAQGNPNGLTKEEIKARSDAEIKLGKKEIERLRVPPFVKDDEVAYKLWKELVKEYKSAAKQGVDLLTTSDISILAIYCKTYAEYEKLLKSYQTIDKVAYDQVELDHYIEDSEEFNFKVKLQLRKMIAVDGLLRIETAINKKADMLLKMQDRLFLNPLAKVKNIPQTNKKEEKPSSKFGKFGGGRGA